LELFFFSQFARAQKCNQISAKPVADSLKSEPKQNTRGQLIYGNKKATKATFQADKKAPTNSHEKQKEKKSFAMFLNG
jgi:hypothetical protein